jgi:hypothetical protein
MIRQTFKSRWNWRAAGLALAACAAICCVPGGFAAAPAPSSSTDAKLPPKPKPPFDTFRVFSEPNEKSFTDPKAKDGGRIVQAIKPNHWANVLVETKANQFDFTGTLISAPLDSQQRPIPLERSSFSLATDRGASLPKGQRKSMEALFFPARSRHTTTQVSNRLETSQHVDESPAYGDTLSHMPSYQYFMLVLAGEPGRYRYLKLLDSVRSRGSSNTQSPEEAACYRLVMPPTNLPLALPSHPLCWTTTAVVLWDDVPAGAVGSDQEQSLIDWLHWGGTLVVSGPHSLDTLRATALAAYLPASSGATRSLGAAALAELSSRWTIPNARGERAELAPAEAWSGVELNKDPAAEFVPGTGNLVVERRVGRGRIVCTSFALSEPELWQWPSYDSFFNAVILRRPQRTFDPATGGFRLVEGDNFDPSLVTKVRYLSRDAIDPNDRENNPVRGAVDIGPQGPAWLSPRRDEAAGREELLRLDQADVYKTEPGVAAWNDFSGVSSAARLTLREAAGITVPNRRFVLWMLGVYLIAVVPLNWLFFRLLGHVEWAWFAVPVFAVSWGGAVIWLAQLDIGFARSQTEVDVLELHNGYSRAHLTRYAALYSSLSSSYDVRFEGRSAVAQPFSPDVELLQDQGVSTVVLQSGDEPQLRSFPVSSNATGMLHTEEMFGLEGPLVLRSVSSDQLLLENRTGRALSGAAILRRSLDEDQAAGEMAWLGEVGAGATREVLFEPYRSRALMRARSSNSLTTPRRLEGSLSLHRLLRCTEDIAALEPGEVRLVAWYDGAMEGMHIEPSAPQARRATLVIAHLGFAPFEPLAPDLSLRVESSRRPAIDDPTGPVEATP